jgi:hypothetical protein
MQRRSFLISLDGLSWGQFSALLELMPQVKSVFSKGNHAEIEAAPFTSAHAIWAEILTGRPWHENGCVGYARPDRSLNRLKVFTEDDLLEPVSLLTDEPTVIAANIPIIAPGQRSWLSDGSLPILTATSPSTLDSFFPGGYKPRLYPNLTRGLTNRQDNALQLLTFETERLRSLANILGQQPWKQVAIRLSVFDQLQHLCGSGCFEDEKMFVRSALLALLSRLDEFIMRASEQSALCITSAYSHVKCRSRFNPNAMLEQAGYLRVQDSTVTSARQQSRRLEAFSAVSGIDVSNKALLSMEGRYDAKLTRAAAPVSSCIYLNRASVFEDGIVSDATAAEIADQLQTFLRERLLQHFGGSAQLVINPSPVKKDTKIAVADYIMHIPAVEYFDIGGNFLDWNNVPISCHSSTGFAITNDTIFEQQTLTPCDLNRKLLGIGFGSK